jgi:hypothetical protein
MGPGDRCATTARRWPAVVVRVDGIVLLLLGVIHELAIPVAEYGKALRHATAPFANEYTVYFGAVGLFILLLGVLDLLCVDALRGPSRELARRVVFASSLSSTICGLVGVGVFGPSPPLVLLLCGVGGMAAALACRQGDARLGSSSPAPAPQRDSVG